MARGRGPDRRETFAIDSVNLRSKAAGALGEVLQLPAPQDGTIELYFKGGLLYKMSNTGVETPIENRIAEGTPASATSSGAAGTIAWDANYIYICVATSTWKRVAISTW